MSICIYLPFNHTLLHQIYLSFWNEFAGSWSNRHDSEYVSNASLKKISRGKCCTCSGCKSSWEQILQIVFQQRLLNLRNITRGEPRIQSKVRRNQYSTWTYSTWYVERCTKRNGKAFCHSITCPRGSGVPLLEWKIYHLLIIINLYQYYRYYPRSYNVQDVKKLLWLCGLSQIKVVIYWLMVGLCKTFDTPSNSILLARFKS